MTISEREIIDFIKKKFPIKDKFVKVSIGDDAALLNIKNAVLSNDLLVENTHFSLKWQYPELIGKKVILANISDMLSKFIMPPYYFLMGIGIPINIEKSLLQDILMNINLTLREYNSFLIGGDVVRSPVLFFSITVIGKKENSFQWIPRKVKKKLHLYLSSTIGESAIGLYCLQNKIDEFYFIKKHLKPNIPLKVVEKLKQNNLIPSLCIDLSDSFVETLHLIKNEDFTLFLSVDNILSKKVKEFCKKYSLDPLEYALTIGEEYQLLMGFEKKIKDDYDLIYIGYSDSFKKSPFLITYKGKNITEEYENHFRHF